MLIFCAFDNDDMESSKRRVSFFVIDFSFKKDIQFMVTIETEGAFDCMRNSDFRFCKRTRNSKRISSPPPEKSVQVVGFNK